MFVIADQDQIRLQNQARSPILISRNRIGSGLKKVTPQTYIRTCCTVRFILSRDRDEYIPRSIKLRSFPHKICFSSCVRL